MSFGKLNTQFGSKKFIEMWGPMRLYPPAARCRAVLKALEGYMHVDDVLTHLRQMKRARNCYDSCLAGKRNKS